MNKSLLFVVVFQSACSNGEPEPSSAGVPPDRSHEQWERLDTVAVLGSGSEWSEVPLYRVSDAVLDNERNAVFLVNGGNSELIRHDLGNGQTLRFGRRGSGPGEFRRPLWLEPQGSDSLLVYDRDLTHFSIFSRSGSFGRTFRVPGIGLRGRQPVALTRGEVGTWVAISSGLPEVLLAPETPSGTKARDTVTIVRMTDEGHLSDTLARVPHALWGAASRSNVIQYPPRRRRWGCDDLRWWRASVHCGPWRFVGSVRTLCRRVRYRIAELDIDGGTATWRDAGFREPPRNVVDRREKFDG